MHSTLMQDKKIANATHNMVAYRFEKESGDLEEHRDDDGEGGAGDKMLFVLRARDARNVMVLVTRWYGTSFGTDWSLLHLTDFRRKAFRSCAL